LEHQHCAAFFEPAEAKQLKKHFVSGKRSLVIYYKIACGTCYMESIGHRVMSQAETLVLPVGLQWPSKKAALRCTKNRTHYHCFNKKCIICACCENLSG
jgi:hypothetical protein